MWKRRKLLFSLAMLFSLGLAAASSIAWAVREAADPGRLSGAQWLQLVRRQAQRDAAAGPSDAADGAIRPLVLAAGAGEPPVQPSDARAAEPARGARRPQALDLETLARQAAAYAAERAKTVVELQKFRSSTSARVRDEDGREALATLTNLNPAVNAWHLLELRWLDGSETRWHVVNTSPEDQELLLDEEAGSLTIDGGQGQTACSLWSRDATARVAAARRARTPYLKVCDERLALRLETRGNRTSREWAADFLRDKIPGGERLTVLVRGSLYADAFLDTAELGQTAQAPVASEGMPQPARVAAPRGQDSVVASELGIARSASGPMAIGSWYPARHVPGFYVSAFLPGLAGAEILASHPDRVSPLDPVEAEALVYLVAFDLERFELGFAVGTDHPRVGWSERVLPSVRRPELPGPDGIADIAPLVATGMVPAPLAERAVASFVGGFKRSHGAFKSSELAQVNAGSHYGFIESGVVLSKLRPGLSTLVVTDDGRVDMRTWTREDDVMLEHVAFARQNGVPLIAVDAASGQALPGRAVRRWSDGNWSGSQDGKLRTVRSGACLQETAEQRRWLVYAYFSSATPSAMARVFQAYGCRHAMLLDMNALEHTYLAVYHLEAGGIAIEHLVQGMSVLDKQTGDATLPRFLGFADNRDFFYVLRKGAGAP